MIENELLFRLCLTRYTGAQIQQTARLYRHDWTSWCHPPYAVLQVRNRQHEYAIGCYSAWTDPSLQGRELFVVQGCRESDEAPKKWWPGPQDPTFAGHEQLYHPRCHRRVQSAEAP